MSETLFCGGCCQNMMIPLTAAERDQLTAAGTHLEPVLHPPAIDEPGWDSTEGQAVIFKQVQLAFQDGRTADRNLLLESATMAQQMQRREGLFIMQGRCALLGMNNECTAYEVRPQICRDFQQGSLGCEMVLDDYELPMAEVSVTIRR